MRLFYSISIPVEVRRTLDQVTSEMAPPTARRVDPSLYHVTLVFLGDQSADDLERYGRVGERVAATLAPFVLRCRDTGRFPPKGPWRVLWAGLEGPGTAQLTQALQCQLREAGLPPGKSGEPAHVTLARSRKAGSKLPKVPRGEFGAWTVRDFALIESVLGSGGPVYTERGRWCLSGSPD